MADRQARKKTGRAPQHSSKEHYSWIYPGSGPRKCPSSCHVPASLKKFRAWGFVIRVCLKDEVDPVPIKALISSFHNRAEVGVKAPYSISRLLGSTPTGCIFG